LAGRVNADGVIRNAPIKVYSREGLAQKHVHSAIMALQAAWDAINMYGNGVIVL